VCRLHALLAHPWAQRGVSRPRALFEGVVLCLPSSAPFEGNIDPFEVCC